MNARSRQKRLYWPDSHTVKYDSRSASRSVRAKSRAWRLVEAEALRLFGDNYILAWDWFTAPAVALGGARPVDLVRAGDRKAVINLLIRMKYCVYM